MFAVVVFPIHVWSFLGVLKRLSGLMLKLDTWELIGLIAYTQLFALLESLGLWLALILMAVVLPARILREKFVAKSSVSVFLLSIFGILIHFELVHWWKLAELLAGLAGCLLGTVVLYVLLHRSKKLDDGLRAFADRLVVLSSIYVLIDLLSVAVVIVRNLGVLG